MALDARIWIIDDDGKPLYWIDTPPGRPRPQPGKEKPTRS